MNFHTVSSSFLMIAFMLYCVSFFLFVISITGKKWSQSNPFSFTRRMSGTAYVITLIAWLCHVTYFFTRWHEQSHVPTSNMYEFMTFLAMMIMLAFNIIYLIYRAPVLGVFAPPVGVIILAYASVFPSKEEALIPALQSYWLKIHVTTAATGEAFFAIGFAIGLMYLLRAVNYQENTKSARRERRGVELTILVILCIVGFVGSTFIFNAFGYKAEFSKTTMLPNKSGQYQRMTETIDYVLPPWVGPYKSDMKSMTPFLGMHHPPFTAPSWMNGVKAGRKLNTVVWSIGSGLLLYWLLRLVCRKQLGAAIHPILDGIDPEDLDEIEYRSIALGYPIFTLGALIFAMIWAQQAWGRFWGWDPKEVWALITWLFYAAYLHLRLSRGWQGKKSAWLSVIGFIIVMFTLIGVNLIIKGLHSYAGV